MSDEKVTTQEAHVEEPVTGKTTFGIPSLNRPTPMWVTWIFRTEFLLNKAAMLWLAATDTVQGDNVKEVILVLTLVDGIVWGAGRFVGIKKEDLEAVVNGV